MEFKKGIKVNMALQRISPESLSGPRAYFTEWNRRSFPTGKVNDTEELLILRKLKSLLLIKRHIIFPAVDLNSQIAFKILSSNPELINKGILLPALRIDKNDLQEVIKSPSIHSFIADCSISVVSWELGENISWFRDRFISELNAENSVIRMRLAELEPSFDPCSLIDALLNNAQSLQDIIDQYSNTLNPLARDVLLSFRRLLYHMSGARVVHSESFLPQENLIDRDILSFKDRVKISEDTIFFKVFVEYALKTLGRKYIPVELIDQLSISEILILREIYESSGFIEKYDKMITSMLSASLCDDPKNAIFHLNQLEEARNYLFSEFTIYFENELKKFNNIKKIESSKAVLGSSISIALGVSGLFLGPVGSLIANLLSLAKDSLVMREVLASMINTYHVFSTSKSIESESALQSAKLSLLKKSLGKMSTDPGLLEAVDKYSSLIFESYKI